MKIEKKRIIYEGRIFTLAQEEWVDETGRTYIRDVIKHPGAVGIIAFTRDGKVVLVKQFRAAVGDYLWEIPAGLLDKGGESPLSCAQRELKEETGYTASRWEKLVTFYTTPGSSDEEFHLYGAWGLIEGDPQTEEDENIAKVSKFSLEEALRMIKKGEIKDGKTLIAIFFAYLLKENGRVP